MKNLRTFAYEKPVLFSALVMLAAIVLTEIPLAPLLAPRMGEQVAFYTAIIVEQSLVGLGLFLIVARFGWMRPAGFTQRSAWKQLWLGWPLVVYSLLNAADFLAGNQVIDFTQPGLILLLLLANLSTGWFEETLGRGVVLTALMQKWGRSRRGIYAAVIVSSGMFGIAHIINLIMGRYPVVNNLAQMVYAMFFGTIFAACVLRNRAIWPMMLMHAAFDLAANLHEVAVGGGLELVVKPVSPAVALVTILVTLPLFLYGLYLLRKVEPVSNNVEEMEWESSSLPTAVIS